MSYCRWSDDSDVYVFDDINGGITCCGCMMNKLQKGHIFPDDSNFKTYREMINHLYEHRKTGHEVPQRAIDGLSSQLRHLKNKKI